MLKDFLATEDLIKKCFMSVYKEINFDPNKDDLIKIKNADGEELATSSNGRRLVNGALQ